jgi:iron-sulfur cluster repair protein YtfE (RIC family)
METISAWMQNDHVHIDAIAERALAAAAARDGAALEREAELFLSRLRRHIEMEEGVLFPAFEQRTGMSASGPSLQMRDEHEQMQPILQQMQAAAAALDGAAWQHAARALHEILIPHNLKEEQMMYPMLDDAMGADAQALLDEVKVMAL